MERCLYKGLFVVLLLTLCQGQDLALPSSIPVSPLTSLDDVMVAVKAAFMEAVKKSAVQEVFEQVVKELGPQENTVEKSPETAYDPKDGLPALAHEHADKETPSLSEENAKQVQVEPQLNSSEQMSVLPRDMEVSQGARLGQEPGEKLMELIYQLNKPAEEFVQEVKDPIANLARDLVASTQEPKESEEKRPRVAKDSELDESQIWSFEATLESEQEEQEGVDEVQQENESELAKSQEHTQNTDEIGEIEKEDGWKKDVETDIESKFQKGGLLELTKQPEPRPDRGQEHRLVTNDDLNARIEFEEKQNEDEQSLDVGGHVATFKTEKERMKEEGGPHIGEKSLGGETEVVALSPVSNAEDMTYQKLETNDLNDIVTSRDPVPNWDVPTLDTSENALPSFTSLGIELGESDELVEKPADKTESATPKQDAWKIGVIAITFFLILQILVTVAYVLKCKKRRNCCTVSETGCEDGVEAVEQDAKKPDTDEQTPVDDLPENSQIHQETIAMTLIHTHGVVEKSFAH